MEDDSNRTERADWLLQYRLMHDLVVREQDSR